MAARMILDIINLVSGIFPETEISHEVYILDRDSIWNKALEYKVKGCIMPYANMFAVQRESDFL